MPSLASPPFHLSHLSLFPLPCHALPCSTQPHLASPYTSFYLPCLTSPYLTLPHHAPPSIPSPRFIYVPFPSTLLTYPYLASPPISLPRLSLFCLALPPSLTSAHHPHLSLPLTPLLASLNLSSHSLTQTRHASPHPAYLSSPHHDPFLLASPHPILLHHTLHNLASPINAIPLPLLASPHLPLPRLPSPHLVVLRLTPTPCIALPLSP